MPCYKCSNGKWKYGERGRCQFDTLESCQAAEAAIHARENEKDSTMKKPPGYKPTKPRDEDMGDDRVPAKKPAKKPKK